MKTLAVLILTSSITGCYTTLVHPELVRTPSMSASESCNTCHEKSSEIAYYADDDQLKPLIEPSENDPVEEFVELTRTRVRVAESEPLPAPVFPQAVWIVQPVFQSSASQAPQLETPKEKSAGERRTYGLRTATKKEKERKFE